MAQPKLAHSTEKLKDTAVKMERGTERMARDTARMEFSADRRTELAANRTMFAAERTYAAWVRTGLVAMASGVGAKPALSGLLPNWLIGLTGTVLVLFSVFCFAAAVWRQFYAGPPPPVPDAKRLHPALMVLLNSFLALVSIACLIGIWFGRPV
jgi:putative membrane protein